MPVRGVLKISEGANLAIHALAFLAGLPDGELASTDRMARSLHVSKDHLGKVMQRLTRNGLVHSRRGPGGGFSLVRPPSEVTLLEVVQIIEGPIVAPPCLLGRSVCEPGTCMLSSLSMRVHAQVVEMLSKTTLAQLPSPGLGRSRGRGRATRGTGGRPRRG
jgi:Rrf2 family protein